MIPIRARIVALTVAIAAAVAPVHAAGLGVRAIVLPETVAVAPGDTFTVQLVVPAARDSFNGYDAVLEFDPAALHFVPQAKAVQQSPLLLGGCGNTFYSFAAAGDSVHANETMLCNTLEIPGPGVLLTLKFVATGSPQVTAIRPRRLHFYNDGYYVLPVETAGTTVALGVTLGAPPASAPSPGLRAWPNPARGETTFALPGAPASGRRVQVCDLAGRCVRRLLTDAQGRARWDGRDDSGRRVPAGVYHVIETGTGTRSGLRIVRLD